MTQSFTENYLELDEVMADGYGIVSRKVLRADFISTKAKALYSYLCSFAGSGDTAFPSTDVMRKELQLSKDTFYGARSELEAFGIIEINTFNTRNGRKTIYKLVSNAHITDDAKALVEHKMTAKTNKVNNLPNSTDPRKTSRRGAASKKTTKATPAPKAVICDTPVGYDALEKTSLKKVHSHELKETIDAYNAAVKRGYTPKEIIEAYQLYVDRYRQEHPSTIRYAKRLKNYLNDSDGLLFDAGKPRSVKHAVIKRSPEVIAADAREKAEAEARIELESNDEEFRALNQEFIELSRTIIRSKGEETKEVKAAKARMEEIQALSRQKIDRFIEDKTRA